MDEKDYNEEEWNNAFKFKESKCDNILKCFSCRKITFKDNWNRDIIHYALFMEYAAGGVLFFIY
jgi:hypothetical protein